jgi:hypothetical protein
MGTERERTERMASAKTKIDVELLSDEDLIAEVHERMAAGLIADDEFCEHDNNETEEAAEPEVESPEDMIEAACRWQRGERKEALHYLEYALGRDFLGLGDMKPEDIR